MTHIDRFINGPLQWSTGKNFQFWRKISFFRRIVSFAKKKRTKSIFIDLFPSKLVPEAIKSIICWRLSKQFSSSIIKNITEATKFNIPPEKEKKTWKKEKKKIKQDKCPRRRMGNNLSGKKSFSKMMKLFRWLLSGVRNSINWGAKAVYVPTVKSCCRFVNGQLRGLSNTYRDVCDARISLTLLFVWIPVLLSCCSKFHWIQTKL